MLGAIKDLLNSEKAVASGALVICATVLAALGHMSIELWTDFCKWTLTVYVAGKTVTSGIAMMTDKKSTELKVEVKDEVK